ncbi:MAG: copper resistance protein CopC, partial [Pantoea sp.]|nr:copper resistance protein CopC [Pantoea sp.]
KVAAGGDPKTMVITPAKPLVPGTYKVEWRAVSSDTHPRTGNVSFSVK